MKCVIISADIEEPRLRLCSPSETPAPIWVQSEDVCVRMNTHWVYIILYYYIVHILLYIAQTFSHQLNVFILRDLIFYIQIFILLQHFSFSCPIEFDFNPFIVKFHI